MFLISRESREKRERPGPMNLSHTDLTNLTKAYIAYARMCHPAESTRLGRQAASFLRCSPFREIREIRVKQKTTMEEDFVRSVRFV